MSSPAITIDAAPETEDPFDLDLRLITGPAGAAGPDMGITMGFECITPTWSCSCVACGTRQTCLCTQTSCGSPPPC